MGQRLRLLNAQVPFQRFHAEIVSNKSPMTPMQVCPPSCGQQKSGDQVVVFEHHGLSINSCREFQYRYPSVTFYLSLNGSCRALRLLKHKQHLDILE